MDPYELGLNYYYGFNGYEKNQELGLNFMDKAVEQRNINAAFFLGSVYKGSAKSLQYNSIENNTKAMYYFQLVIFLWSNKAPSNISLEKLYSALMFVALMYEPADIITAKYFYELAIDLGYPLDYRLNCILGLHYNNKDYETAYRYFKKAQQIANNNQDEWCIFLARMYENGQHVEKDYTKAIYYYKLVKNNLLFENINIYKKIAELYIKGGFNLDISIDMAMTYLNKSIKLEPGNKEIESWINYYASPIVATLHSFPTNISEKILNLKHPEEFVCPLCLDLLMNPVVCNDGRSYERSQIELLFSFKKNKNHNSLSVFSPFNNNQEIFYDKIVENRNLMDAIIRYVRSKGEELASTENRQQLVESVVATACRLHIQA